MQSVLLASQDTEEKKELTMGRGDGTKELCKVGPQGRKTKAGEHRGGSTLEWQSVADCRTQAPSVETWEKPTL